MIIEKKNADTENRTQVSDLQDQCNNHYTIPAFFYILFSCL